MPGVSQRTAEVIVAETGADMSRVPTAGALGVLGPRLCPGHSESTW